MADKPRIRASITSDGLINVMSGLGTSKSKNSHNTWQLGIVGGDSGSLEASYQSNWIAQKIVDCRAEDETRKWRRIKSEGAEEIAALEDSLHVPTITQEARKWARLFGGAGILMVTDQPFDKPLDVRKIKKDSLKSLIVFDRWDLHGQDFNLFDFMSPNYQRPTYYTLGTTNAAAQRIHHSHIVRHEGIQLPRRLRHLAQGWGDSVLNRCIEDISEMVAAKSGIANLLQEANVDVINRVGLSEELASGEDGAIIDRYALFSRMKSVVNMALLDGDETYSRQTLNLTGVAPILEQMLTYISGAADTPVTRMFGTSAKGMNATGEGDLNNYYDSITASQSSKLTEPMRHLDEVLIRSALGYFPDSFDYVWNPLGTPDDVQIAQAQLLQAQKNRIYLEDQIVKKSQVMRELQGSEEYQFDDEMIEELEENETDDLLADLPPVKSDSNELLPSPPSTL
jgi:uncharacterized protein